MIPDKPPFKCPSCRFSFSLPEGGIGNLPTNYFTFSLLNSPMSPLMLDDSEDLICEICDTQEATTFCKQCAQYFCDKCHKPHKKIKTTAHHQFISIEEALEGPARMRIPYCQKHPNQEIDSFCNGCREAICPACGIKFHSGHQFSPLKDVTNSFKQEISNKLKKVC